MIVGYFEQLHESGLGLLVKTRLDLDKMLFCDMHLNQFAIFHFVPEFIFF